MRSKIKWLVPAALCVALQAAGALDLDVTGFVQRVSATSRTLRSATLDITSASAQRRSATSLALPRVDASAQIGREMLSIDRLDPVPFRYQGTFGVGLSQTLFNMSVIYGLRAAADLDGMTRAATEATRQGIVNGARKAFYGAMLAREAQNVSRESEAAALDNLNNARLRFDSGAASQFDVLQAEAAYLAIIPQRIRTERDYQVALNSLKNLAGIGLSDDLQLVGSLEAPAQAPPLAAEESALQKRPDLQAMQWQRKLQDEAVLATQAQAYPSLGARLQYTNYGVSNALDWANTYDNLILGFSLTVPIFASGATGAAVHKAQIDRDKTALRVDQLSDDIRADTRNARLRLQQTALMVEAAARSAQAAQQALDITASRVSGGASTQLELTQSRVARDQARVGYFAAVYDLLSARFDWEMATGTVP